MKRSQVIVNMDTQEKNGHETQTSRLQEKISKRPINIHKLCLTSLVTRTYKHCENKYKILISAGCFEPVFGLLPQASYCPWSETWLRGWERFESEGLWGSAGTCSCPVSSLRWSGSNERGSGMSFVGQGSWAQVDCLTAPVPCAPDHYDK